MYKVRIFLIMIGLLITIKVSCAEADDLFSQKKSDASIKPLVFPLSLVVVESRPDTGHYFFVYSEEGRFPHQLHAKTNSDSNKFDQIFSDPKIIRKTLVGLDRARINPAEIGEDIRGPVTKELLEKTAKKYSRDLVLVFRREIQINSDAPIPQTVIKEPEDLFDARKTGPFSLRILNRALVYLAKQNKVLVVPFNEKSKSFFSNGRSPAREQLMAGVHQLSSKGLEDLAVSAEKIIKDKQFVVRRPSY